jgi:ribosomal protein L37E
VRPLIAFAKRPKGDRAREPGMIRHTKKCANCGTGRSSRWMVGPDGEDNCSECGLFWMYHKMRRPLGVGVGIDVIGPKRDMTRGPKIMESGRKRRLGSVNTGSGSDTEMEDRVKEEEEGMEKYYEMMERELMIEEREKSEMEVDLPEVSDDTPVSLLNLTILARKVQRTTLSSSRSNCSALSRVITS